MKNIFFKCNPIGWEFPPRLRNILIIVNSATSNPKVLLALIKEQPIPSVHVTAIPI